MFTRKQHQTLIERNVNMFTPGSLSTYFQSSENNNDANQCCLETNEISGDCHFLFLFPEMMFIEREIR